MNIKNLLSQDSIQLAVPCSSKKRAFEIIAKIAAKHIEQSPQKIFESLLTREKLGSTGIGHGIAVPHGKIPNSPHAICVFLRSDTLIDFDAIDNQGVDLLFALLVPENQCEMHLDTLAEIAKLCSQKHICKQLREATSEHAVYEIITG